MPIDYNGNGSWMEVEVDEDGSGFSFYYEMEPTGNYEGGDSGDNFTSTFLMPWPQRSAWIGIFVLMLVVAIAGNALVAWIVLGLYLTTPIKLIAMELHNEWVFFFFFLNSSQANEKCDQLFSCKFIFYLIVYRAAALIVIRLSSSLWKIGERESSGPDHVLI